MNKKWPDLAEDVAKQVIERIHVFKRDPVFQANPTKQIGVLRLNRPPSDDVALKAIVYLSDKYRFSKKRH